jgi:hypothetical protein
MYSAILLVYPLYTFYKLQFINNGFPLFSKYLHKPFLKDEQKLEVPYGTHEIRKRKANWIGHILRRNCLLQRVIEGKIQGGIEVTGRRGRRRKKIPDDLKERRGYSHLKEEALDRTMESSLWKRLWTCRNTDYLNE